MFVVHNLSARPVAPTRPWRRRDGVDDLLELREHRFEGGRLRVELDAYGYLWLRARR